MLLCVAVYAVLPASPTLLVLGLAVIVVAVTALALTAPRSEDGTLGAANRVTLVRAVLALPVLAMAPFPEVLTDGGRWLAVALASVVLVLDGVDGWVARRTGTESAFGARFDMELDALLLLGLSVLVWQAGQTGPWVLLIGAMRYGFVVAGWLLPWMQRPLPASLRRKAACVVQGVVLAVIAAPLIPPWLATVAAALALLLLTGSFAADTRWLASQRSAGTQP